MSLRLISYLSFFILIYISPSYGLTSQKIKEICKSERNYLTCIRNTNELEKSYNNVDKKLFTPTSIKVIPYQSTN